jgi:osmotically-inducible protein OsmY
MSRNYQQDRDWREREGRNRERDNFPSRDDQDYRSSGEGRYGRDEQDWRGPQDIGYPRNRDDFRQQSGQRDRGYNLDPENNQQWGQYRETSRGRDQRTGRYGSEGELRDSRYGGDQWRQGQQFDQGGFNQGQSNQSQYNQGQYRQYSQGQFTGRGPRNYKRGDDRIAEDINERLTQHGTLDASDIEVSVQNGEVTLKGNVDSRQAKRLAEEIAESASGVKDVTNQIKVQQSAGTETQTSGKNQNQQRKAS